MSFAVAAAKPKVSTERPGQLEADIEIQQGDWPVIKSSHVREILRLPGTVTNERLVECLTNAVYVVNDQLSAWRSANSQALDECQSDLYRRAVYFYAQAELYERYLDVDASASAQRRAEDYDSMADDARRVHRWAVRDFLGLPRLVVEAL